MTFWTLVIRESHEREKRVERYRSAAARAAGHEEVSKGGRWMPRLSEATKDAISRDSPGGGANIP